MGELKHLSTPRKRDYSLSSGERKGRSPNRAPLSGRPAYAGGGVVRRARDGATVSVLELQSLCLAEGPWKGPPQRVRAP